MSTRRGWRAVATTALVALSSWALGSCCGDDLQVTLLRVQGGRFGNERLIRAVYKMRNCAPGPLQPTVTGRIRGSDGSEVAGGRIAFEVPIGDTCQCITYRIPPEFTMSVPGEFTASIEAGGTVATLPLSDFAEALAGCDAVCNGQ